MDAKGSHDQNQDASGKISKAFLQRKADCQSGRSQKSNNGGGWDSYFFQSHKDYNGIGDGICKGDQKFAQAEINSHAVERPF